jgi:carbamoyltransferase
MYILGINFSHHGSICLLKDGEIVFFLEEERLSKEKYTFITNNKCKVFSKIKNYTDKLDYIVLSWPIELPVEYRGMHSLDKFNEVLTSLIKHPQYPQYNIDSHSNILKLLTEVSDSTTRFSVAQASHHQIHAAQSFYNSGFNESVCVVVDGQGSCFNIDNTYTYEKESIWLYNYETSEQLYCKYDIDQHGIGSIYSRVTGEIGFRAGYEEGKTMGLSSYEPSDGVDAIMSHKIELAKGVQNWSQEQVLNLIKHAIEISGYKNVCISGGYGLNCVSNYYFRKNLPVDINLYCEPIANDAGQSIGLVKELYHRLTGDNTIRPQKSIYLGPSPEY